MVDVSLGVSLGVSLDVSFSWEPSIAFRNPEASQFDPMVVSSWEEDRFSTLVACCKMSPVDGDALGVETAGVGVRRSG